MKKTLFLCFIVLSVHGIAQITDTEKQLKAQQSDTILGWKKSGIFNLTTSQTSLTNWAAGGQSSFALNGLLDLQVNYRQEKYYWENFLELGYGTMKQPERDWWKTDDRIQYTSKYGHKMSGDLYFAGLVDFRTQFSNGFNYPNDSVLISKFMAPGYLLGAVGFEYKPSAGFDVFFAPVTGKFTFVMDQALSDSGAFGVKRGDQVYSEFGGYMRMFLKKDIMENITFQTNLDLFSNYMHNPGNIDVNWQTLLSLKVNKFISATVSTDMIYDDDIKIAKDNNGDGIIDEKGPRLQFKEVLALGLSYKF
jgi:hypothetical protein